MKRFVVLSLLLAGCGLHPRPALAQTYGLAPVGHQQFFTNGGLPASGYFLCTFSAGTSTPLAIASDNLGTALPDPITLNAAGRPQTAGATETGIYLQFGQSYKFILYAPGVGNNCNGTVVGAVVWTQDNVPNGTGQFGHIGVGVAPDSVIPALVETGDGAFPTASGSTKETSLALRLISDNSTTALDFGTQGTSSAPWLQVRQTGNFANANVLLLNPNGGGVGIGTGNSSLPATTGLTISTGAANAATIVVNPSNSGFSTIDCDKSGSGTALPCVLIGKGNTTINTVPASASVILNGSNAGTPPFVDTNNVLNIAMPTASDYAGTSQFLAHSKITAVNTFTNSPYFEVTAASNGVFFDSSATGAGTAQPYQIRVAGSVAASIGVAGGVGGMAIGVPTGGVPATGSLNLQGSLFANNTTVVNNTGQVVAPAVSVGNAPANTVSNYLSLGTVTVGSLPAAGATNKGQLIQVSDSTAVASEGQTCAGGSSNVALAFSTGSVWKCF